MGRMWGQRAKGKCASHLWDIEALRYLVYEVEGVASGSKAGIDRLVSFLVGHKECGIWWSVKSFKQGNDRTGALVL